MTHYTLSVVQLCPDAYRDAANALAEAAGYGPDNLSVELRHTDGSTWWGCHAWWMPSALAAALDAPEDPSAAEVLAHVVTSAQETADAQAHWQEALAANGLHVPEAPDA